MDQTVENVVDEIFQSVLASPQRQRRLYSRTFWGKFGFKARSKARVDLVQKALNQRGLMINLSEDEFGKEANDSWLVITYLDPKLPQAEDNQNAIPFPPDAWFERMAQRKFESEREVEYYFILPLVEQLGYQEEDIAVGIRVQMFEGTTRVEKEADLVLYNGPSRDKEADALVMVEAKIARKNTDLISGAAIGQARSYAVWLSTPYYVVTNGNEIQVFISRGAGLPDVLMNTIKKDQLKQQWKELYTTLNKAAVIDYKNRLREMLAKREL
jgi:hypothetical protein